MTEIIPPPDPHSLLPQLLACLPAAFVSPRPPPALGPLLSPVLRQRVELLSSTSISSRDETWLNLLCWDNDKASRVREIVESTTFEPHPVSGELEIESVENVIFKRFDKETLRAQVPLPEWDLTVIYLWCSEEHAKSDWKVAELLPYNLDFERDPSWHSSISEATNCFNTQTSAGELNPNALLMNGKTEHTVADEDDSDYWAQYDRTPNRTPAKGSAAPGALKSQGPSEQDYYARYGSVQAAMDAHDPEEHSDTTGNSTLNGDTFTNVRAERRSLYPADPPRQAPRESEPQMYNPQPSPPLSQGSDTVAKLEESAEAQTFSEIGVRQHISTSVKSMYRLAKSCGMDREEFRRIIDREMDVLALLED